MGFEGLGVSHRKRGTGAHLQALQLGERHLNQALRVVGVAGEGDADVAVQPPARGRGFRAEEG